MPFALSLSKGFTFLGEEGSSTACLQQALRTGFGKLGPNGSS